MMTCGCQLSGDLRQTIVFTYHSCSTPDIMHNQVHRDPGCKKHTIQQILLQHRMLYDNQCSDRHQVHPQAQTCCCHHHNNYHSLGPPVGRHVPWDSWAWDGGFPFWMAHSTSAAIIATPVSSWESLRMGLIIIPSTSIAFRNWPRLGLFGWDNRVSVFLIHYSLSSWFLLSAVLDL